jgi:hypothetical protein
VVEPPVLEFEPEPLEPLEVFEPVDPEPLLPLPAPLDPEFVLPLAPEFDELELLFGLAGVLGLAAD